MPITPRHLSVLALLAMAPPLAAQDAPQPAPGDAPAQTEPAAPATPATPEAGAGAAEGEAGVADPASGLDMGQPVGEAAGEPQVGQPYIREEFGDWSLRCLRTEDGNDPCQIYQLLLDPDGNAVAEISMFPLPEGREAAAGATIVAPLETLLTENLTISVDGGNARTYPFTFCNTAGCVARVGFTGEEVQQFRAGNAAQLSIVPAAAPDQRVDLTISLSGFTAAYEASAQSAPTLPVE